MIETALQSLKPDYISIKGHTPVLGVYIPQEPKPKRYLVKCGDAWDWTGLEHWQWMWIDSDKEAVMPKQEPFLRTTRSLVLNDGFEAKKAPSELMDGMFFGFRNHRFWFFHRHVKSYHHP